MATDMQRLIVALEARTKAFETAMNKANGVAQKRARSIETAFSRANKGISTQLAGMARGFAGAFAAQATLQGAQRLIDTSTRIENSLKVAGLAGAELTRVYDALFASAQKNAAPLESLVTLYGRASIVQKELGVTTQELLGFTDNVALALRVAGSDAQSASGALLQLSQALGSGVVRAEEFNSILEGALPIALAAAAGLEEAGGSVAKLRQLVVDGKVSSEAFFRAFEAGAPMLADKVANAELTVGQAMVRLQNTLIKTAGEFDDVTGVSGEAAEALDKLGRIIEALSNIFAAAADGPIGSFINKLGIVADILAKIEPLSRALGIVLNEDVLNGIAQAINPPTGPEVVTTGGKGGRIRPTKPDATVETVSLNDFKPPAGDKKGGGRKSRESPYQRETESIRERTEALKAETEAQALLNPLVDDYGFAVEKARAVHELLTAAQEAGLEITPALREQIESLATGYADASVAAKKLAEEQDRVRSMAEDFSNFSKDVFGSFIQDMKNGVSAADALQNALSRIADKLLEIALNAIFSGGGFFSGIAKLFMKDGGHVKKMAGGGRVRGPGGPRSDKVPAMLSNGEHVTRAAMVQKHGKLLDAINADRVPRFAAGGIVGPGSAMTGGGVRGIAMPQVTQVNFSPVINAQGADAAGLARVENSLRELAKNVPKMVDARIGDKQTRGTRP